MSIQIITTSQAPDSKPIGKSLSLTDEWQTLVEVPSYEVPEQAFGGSTIVVPGVGEIISPLLVCNSSGSSATLSVRVYRAEPDANFTIVNELLIPANDTMTIPLNGQFIFTGDKLEIKSDTNNVIDVTLSFTVGQAEQDDVA